MAVYKADCSHRIAIASHFVEMSISSLLCLQLSQFPSRSSSPLKLSVQLTVSSSSLHTGLFSVTLLFIRFVTSSSRVQTSISPAIHFQVPIERTMERINPLSACGNEKDRCCTGSSEDYPEATGLFPGYPDYQYPSTCAALPYYPASIDYRHSHYNSSPFASGHRGGEGVPTNGYPQAPSDLWTCSECGAENHDWCNICGECGLCTGPSNSYSYPGSSVSHYNTPKYSVHASPDFNSFGGAGSAAPGSWYCTECGGANSVLNDNCADPACGAPKPT
jgi:hypothetical protein